MKKTVVLGASPNPSRFANMAVKRLTSEGIEAIPVGIRDGEIVGIPILKGQPMIENVDTITLYIGPQRQPPYYDYILDLKPNRIIFNPGTENPELMQLAASEGIDTELGCTLVMLSTATY